MSSNHEHGPVRSAIISTDVELCGVVKSAARQPESLIAVEHEVHLAFADIDSGVLSRLWESEVELIVLDLADDPALGIRFAQYLTEANAGFRLLAVGPTLSAEQLLQAMRAGIMEYVPRPVELEAFQEAVERVRRKSGPSRAVAAAQQLGRVFTFYSARGGCGATTCAINVAVLLRQLTEKRVLLLDLDLEFGSIPLALGMEPQFSLLDVVKNLHRMDVKLLESYIATHPSGVHVLPTPPQLEAVVGISGDHVRKVLHLVRQHFDYVLVDTARSFTPATLAGLEQASQVLLVTTADLPSLRNLKRCLPVFERITRGSADRVRLVVNRHHPKDPITTDDVRRALGLPVSWTLSNDYPSVIRSLNEGKPVSLDGRSGYVRDLQSVSRELAGSPAAEPDRGGLLAPLRQVLDRFGRKPEVLPVPRRPAEVTPHSKQPEVATHNG